MSSSTTAEAGQPVPALASLVSGPARPPGHPAGGARQMGKGSASPGPPCPWNMARPVGATVPRACPALPGSDPPAGEAPRGGGAVAVSEGRKGGGGTEHGCEGEGRQAIEAPERMNSMGEPGSAEEAASSPGVARWRHLKCGAGRHARRPGRRTHKAREGCSRTRGLEGACLEACRVTAHQH